MDEQRYYIASDINLLLDIFKNELAFLKSNWKILGRPIIVINLRSKILGTVGLVYHIRKQH